MTSRSAGRDAARVGGTPISSRAVEGETQEVLANAAYRAGLAAQRPDVSGDARAFTAAITHQVLNRLIYTGVVHQEFRRRHLVPDEVSRSEGRARLIEELGHDFSGGDTSVERGERILHGFSPAYRRVLIQRQVEQLLVEKAVAKIEVDDQATTGYYDTHLDEFTQVCARHVLLDTEAEAAAVRRDLQTGADFPAVAQLRSRDAQTADQGGDVGCSSPSTYPAPFAEALRTQPVGDVGAPVSTSLGWHVIQVLSRQVTPLATARSEIVTRLSDARRRAFEAWLEQAVRKTDVDVDGRFGTFDLTRPVPQVVP